MSIRRFTLSIIRGTHLDDHAALAEALSQWFVVVYQCSVKSLDTFRHRYLVGSDYVASRNNINDELCYRTPPPSSAIIPDTH